MPSQASPASSVARQRIVPPPQRPARSRIDIAGVRTAIEYEYEYRFAECEYEYEYEYEEIQCTNDMKYP
jgi:hypothetical protein